MKSSLLGLLLLASSLFGTPTFKERLREGSLGDFIVTEQGKTVSFLMIRERDATTLTLEEITLPQSKLPPSRDWQAWYFEGAPRATSHLIYQIDLIEDQCQNSRTIGKNSLNQTQEYLLLNKLLKAPLTLISESERKKIGSENIEGPNTRKIWNPPLFYQGKLQKGVKLNAYRLKWPDDNSELSQKTLEIYFYDTFPFPVWMEVLGNGITFKMRNIDAGKIHFDSLTKH